MSRVQRSKRSTERCERKSSSTKDKHHKFNIAAPTESIASNYSPMAKNLKINQFSENSRTEFPELHQLKFFFSNQPKKCHTWSEMKSLDYKCDFPAPESRPMSPECQTLLIQYLEMTTATTLTEDELNRYQRRINGIEDNLATDFDPNSYHRIIKKTSALVKSIDRDQGNNLMDGLMLEVKNSYRLNIKKSIVDYYLLDDLERTILDISSRPTPFTPKVIRSPVPWRNNCEMAIKFCNEFLFISSPILIALNTMWIEKYSHLLFINVKEFTISFNSGKLLETVKTQCDEGRRLISQKWTADVAEEFAKQAGYWGPMVPKRRDNLPAVRVDSLFRCVAAHSSQMIRQMASNSILDFVKYIEKFKFGNDYSNEAKIFDFICLPLLSVDLVVNQSIIAFNPNMESAEQELVNCINAVVDSNSKLPRVELLMFPEIKNLPMFILPLKDTEELVQNSIKSVVDIFQKNVIGPQNYIHKYDKYLTLINPKFESEFKKCLSQEIGTKKFREKLNCLCEMRNEIKLLPRRVAFNLFLLNNSHLHDQLLEKMDSLQKIVVDYFVGKNYEINKRLCGLFEEMCSRAGETPVKTAQLVELSDYLRKQKDCIIYELKEDIETVARNLMFVVDYTILSERDINLNSRVFNWPKTILNMIEMSNARIAMRQDQIEIDLRKRLTEFDVKVHACAKELEVIRKRDPPVLKIEEMRRSVELLQRLTVLLNEVQHELNSINEEERLLGDEPSKFPAVQAMVSLKEPYDRLWTTALTFTEKHEQWFNGPFSHLNAEAIAEEVEVMWRTLYKLTKTFADFQGPKRVAENVKARIEKFRNILPVLQMICNAGMRDRHWEMVEEAVGHEVVLDEKSSLSQMIEAGLPQFANKMEEISIVASKEHSLEMSLIKMKAEWNDVHFDLTPYRETGVAILVSVDDVQLMLDDHILRVQTMRGSPFIKSLESQVKTWESNLILVQDVLDAWLKCQTTWLYLEPIFSSDDIVKQMPVESRKFQRVDQSWREIMSGVIADTKALVATAIPYMLQTFEENNRLLEEIQKGLNDYLDKKRFFFPRFFFVSNDELLEILSETKDPTRVQPHLKKCFEGIKQLEFDENGVIQAMVAADGESVSFTRKIYPMACKGLVEKWLSEVEDVMVASIKENITKAVEDSNSTIFSEWVLSWPGQSVLCARCIRWTADVTRALIQHHSGFANQQSIHKWYESFLAERASNLETIVNMMRGDLNPRERICIGALIVIEVHARDIISKMVSENVEDASDFTWISQLRYYCQDETKDEKLTSTIKVKMITTEVDYGFEYLGNTSRLVLTPLTDRCYRTLMGALKLNLGASLEGPAGTGKSETTKDLAKAVAKQCVVFNCFEGLDYHAMGKFFKGLAQSGAWACFDEFNRINLEVLSVVSQQIRLIQTAKANLMKKFMFEGSELTLDPSCAIFITMNPGYSGRLELPDNLKVLFRSVAMMVPDYAMIGEISLYSYGFVEARVLSRKIIHTYRLCAEQLSRQSHYDYGMRAIKSVLIAAGQLKLKYPQEQEMILVLRALKTVNGPKFTAEDMPLFEEILTDLFPNIKFPPPAYQDIRQLVVQVLKEQKLQPIPDYVEKIMQIYETLLVRHGVMIIGGPLSGKTTAYRILAEVITRFHQKDDPDYKVVYKIINPKSASVKQLYGFVDPVSHEFTDGILASTFREFATSPGDNRRWIVFDGPVDAGWVEHMNTVLDDNKKLCLMNSEIIQMNPNMSLIFESSDLESTSPATVSRCGMIYLEPSRLGWKALKESYMDALPAVVERVQRKMVSDMMDWLFPSTLEFVQKESSAFVATNDMHLVTNTIRLYDGLLQDLHLSGKDGHTTIQNQQVINWLQALFLLAVVWGVAGTLTNISRNKFDAFFRNLLYGMNEKYGRPTTFRLSRLQMFPEKKSVFDYVFECRGNGQWISWLDMIERSKPKLFLQLRSEVIVPTDEAARQIYFINHCLSRNIPLLVLGPTGTGKTAVTNAYLATLPKDKFVTNNVNFSFRTTVSQAQEMVMSRLDRRRKGVFGPPLNKKCVVFIDDINISSKDSWDSQPPIELLRQWIDNGHWYDQSDNSKLELIETLLLAAMDPKVGRSELHPRFLRHFHLLSIDAFEEAPLCKIFGSVMEWHFGRGYDSNIFQLTRAIVQATIGVYKAVLGEFLPTPSKSHYVFTLRDLSRVIHGMMQVPPNRLKANDKMMRLWIHEMYRVFHDRLADDADRNSFFDMVKTSCQREFRLNLDVILGHLVDVQEVLQNVTPKHVQQLFFGDYVDAEVEQPEYDEIMEPKQVVQAMTEYLKDHDMVTRTPMNLVLFHHTVEHVSRLHRILTQNKNGHALLIGISGSGRRSVTRLAAFMANMEVHQVVMSRNYGFYEWREDIKSIIRQTGTEGKPAVFLFAEDQMRDDAFLEDLNVLLKSGDITNLYTPEEKAEILEKIQSSEKNERLDNSPLVLYEVFLEKVRQNLHIVITISPVGDSFRNRLRMFPALTNCCTIDWFSTWPDEALKMVAEKYFDDMDLQDDIKEKCVAVSCYFHQSVVELSQRYFAEFGRWNYVTPTSYLELIRTFKALFVSKRCEITDLRNRYVAGLDKLDFAASQVTLMQAQLIEEQPKLIKTTEETEQLMIKIEQDTMEVEAKKEIVAADEALANSAAAEAQAIKDECENDLAEATPALESAIASLNTLKPQDITVIKSMKNPPSGVKLVMEAICIMKGIKPERKPETGGSGKMIEDYWAPSLKLVSDLKFLEHLKAYNKDDVPAPIMKVIRQRYISNPEFDPYVIRSVCAPCEGLCQWICAIEVYDRVAKIVAPKKEKLGNATADLGKQMEKLNEKRSQLQEVTDKLQILNDEFIKKTKEKKDLEDRIDLCQKKLERASKLIGGLGSEKQRWSDMALDLATRLDNVVGDVLVSGGIIAYLGAFTAELRQECVDKWLQFGRSNGLTFSSSYSLVATLGSPLQIREWHIAGLPIDQFSTDNAIIVTQFRKFPLMIDPQEQANKWIKNHEKVNKLEVLKQTDRNYLRTLSHCVQLGTPVLIEDIGYDIDPLLQPLLLKNTFKQGLVECIQLADNVVEYHQDFRLYLTTRLPNPHYQPHVTVTLTILNFTITPIGLEDQLLGLVVAKEKPEMEEEKNQLIIENANNLRQLKEIEDSVLEILSMSHGNILEDETTINILSSSKTLAVEITVKQKVGVTTEKAIDEIRNLYRPFATNASTLFFCISELAFVDPMYQYSLNWFINLYIQSIASSKKTVDTLRRTAYLVEHFMVSVYRNVCRSLFEKDRLVFSCILCIGHLRSKGELDELIWKYILTQGMALQDSDSQIPSAEWITDTIWSEILRLSAIPQFNGLSKHVYEHPEVWKLLLDAKLPHITSMPPSWSHIRGLDKVALIKCLRPDKLVTALQVFIKDTLGPVYMESPAFDLSESYVDSDSCTPLIFILSVGADPTLDLLKFGQEHEHPPERIHMLSLGQGQGPVAQSLIEKSLEDGSWVVLQNCHLVASWFPNLEKIVETLLVPEVAHPEFRLWLTCYPCQKFPVSILQNGVKMTNELSYGLKANLLGAYQSSPISSSRFLEDGCPKCPRFWPRLLYGLCFFHGVVRERRNFGPLGWNIPYEFTNADLRISISQLQMFLDESRGIIPVKALTYLTGEINYGGRITDDWDHRLLMSLLSNVYSLDIINQSNYPLTTDKEYWIPSKVSDYDGYVEFIQSLPTVACPSVFGLHDNATMAKDREEASQLLSGLVSTQPKISSQNLGNNSILSLVSEILNKIPQMTLDTETLNSKYPISYKQCINTVLRQEVNRFTRLLHEIRSSLCNIQLATSGHTLLTPELEEMSESILKWKVPRKWQEVSYPSVKPLAGYINDLIARYNFFEEWIRDGEPKVFWISGFFYTRAFLTGVLQNHARTSSISVDMLAFDFEFLSEIPDSSPPAGVYIRGLFLKGARWDNNERKLAESFPRIYQDPMPVIWLKPCLESERTIKSTYECPVYMTSVCRSGSSSAIGDNSNFIFILNIPTDKDPKHWINRGVACLCQIDE